MNDRAPQVSVAVIACDNERFIGEAIESALEQDYPSLEVVIADDNSRDGTRRIIADYAARSPDVIKPVYNDGRRSLSANENRAFAACRGEFVAFLDGDDVFLPGKIASQVEAMLANPGAVICHHPVELIDENGAVIGVEPSCPDLPRAELKDLVERGNFISAPSMMLRRSAMPPGGTPPIVETSSDWVLELEMAHHGWILRLPDVLARYRIHGGQFTAPVRESDFLYDEAMTTLDWVEARHPELHDSCRRGRRGFALWDATRRRPSQDLAWRAAGIRRALRHAPLSRHLARLWLELQKERVRRLFRGASASR